MSIDLLYKTVDQLEQMVTTPPFSQKSGARFRAELQTPLTVKEKEDITRYAKERGYCTIFRENFHCTISRRPINDIEFYKSGKR